MFCHGSSSNCVMAGRVRATRPSAMRLAYRAMTEALSKAKT
jgi:hypothetical protein